MRQVLIKKLFYNEMEEKKMPKLKEKSQKINWLEQSRHLNDPDALVQKMVESWNRPFVKRSEMPDFTFGLLTRTTCSNHDFKHAGPANRLIIGGKTAYPLADAAEWVRRQIARPGSQPPQLRAAAD